MTNSNRPFSWTSLLGFLLLSPFYALYGVLTLVRGLFAPSRFLRRTRLAMASDIRCPNGHPNSATGRFDCASCHATYHGWIGRCALCGAGAGWFPCGTCGVGVRRPWSGP